MIAALALAVLGLMAAALAVAVGAHRAMRQPDTAPPVTAFKPLPDPDTDPL